MRPSTQSYAPLLLAVLLVAACGVRTEPRPPEHTAARAPEDFEARVKPDGGVELSWERPTKTVDGGRLYDLSAFAVERRSSDTSFVTLVTMAVTDTDRLRTQRTFHYVDLYPPPGELEYRVRAVTADGESGVASKASVTASREREPPAPGQPASEPQPEPQP